MEAPFQLLHLEWAELALVGGSAFAASVLGGLAGYGVGLILPIVLTPIVGVAHVIPVMAVATAITNASRCTAFHREIDWAQARRILCTALPASAAGTWLFTQLNTQWIGLTLGLVLLASVPVRRLMRRSNHQLSPQGVALASAGYGALAGSMTGTGVLLLGILMASGLHGGALIGTDAAISLITNMVKIVLLHHAARLDVELAFMGLLIGLCTVPGAYTARWLLNKMPLAVHESLMDCVIVAGACSILWNAM